MLPYYDKFLCPLPLGPVDEALKGQMKSQNDDDLAKIQERIKDANENLGDIEIRDALLAKAEFYNRIGDKDAAIQAYQDSFEKTVGVGGKLDNILAVIRIAFFFDDIALAKKEIDRAKVELGKGGDWERRNKLKVYEGMFLMISRSWKEAATLFLNVMPTFTAVELVEFKDFVFYAVILAMVSLDRPTLREKLVNSPEVLSAIKETPHLQAMAAEFGVSASFIDAELSSFISSGKLTCKIDKVGGVVESNEADNRSQVYVEIIKQGDLLLNRMQKLSGALDM